jgi:hypothetical protein
MVCTCSFFKSSILFLYSCISGISQKTLSPFNSSSQCHSTNRFNNIIHIVNAEAVSSIASRFASISIYSHQLLARHTNLSPSVPSSVFNFFVPKLRWYLNLPHKFYAHVCSNSCRSIFIRLIIGCVKPLVTPGICSLLFIFIYDTFGFTGSPFVMGFKQNDCFNHTYMGYCPLPYWLCPLFLKHGLPQELILLSCPAAIFFYFRIRYIR